MQSIAALQPLLSCLMLLLALLCAHQQLAIKSSQSSYQLSDVGRNADSTALSSSSLRQLQNHL